MYFFSNIILPTEMSMSIFNNLCEKAKADTRTPNSRRGGGGVGGHSFITEMAVFTLETDYS